MRYLLKVFSGPHVGAEVVLPEGESIVGSSDDCDVVLDDRLIGAKHVAVVITGDTIECSAIGDDAVLVDGKPIERMVVRPFQYFTIGTTHLAVGPADQPWPKLDFSDFQLREAVEQEEQDSDTDSTDIDAGTETAATIATPETKEEEAISNRWAMSVPGLAVCAIVGLNLLALFGVVTVGWFGSSVVDRHVHPRQALKRITKPFAPDVRVEGDLNRPQVVGYVATNKDRDALLRAARGVSANVVFKVRSTESLLNSIQELLKHDGWDDLLTATADEPGIVRIGGTLSTYDTSSLDRWRQTETRIEEDVPVKQLVVEFRRSPIIVERRIPTPFQVSLPTTHNSTLASGEPRSMPPGKTVAPEPTSAPPAQVMRNTAAAGATKAADPARSPTHTSKRVKPVLVLDVRIAHDQVVTLEDGRQLSVGGRLPNGMWIESLDLHHAVARSRNGQIMIVPFGTGG